MAIGAVGTFGFIELTKASEDSIATDERIVASVNESVRDDGFAGSPLGHHKAAHASGFFRDNLILQVDKNCSPDKISIKS